VRTSDRHGPNGLRRTKSAHPTGRTVRGRRHPVSFEMTLLGGEKIARDRPAAGIVEFLRVRFWIAFHSADVAEVGVGAVGPAHPKNRAPSIPLLHSGV